MSKLENGRKSAKERHKETILGYLANPDNGYPTRKFITTELLGLSNSSQLYRYFTPTEMSEIEDHGLELRRKRYASRIAMVDDGLMKKAASGDAAAAKLVFQRYENWSEKSRKELSIDGPILQQVLNIFPEDVADKIRLAMLDKSKEIDV